jgi:hypothetical protein
MTDNLYVWSNLLKKNIEDQKEEIFKRDYKFFKIDRLEESQRELIPILLIAKFVNLSKKKLKTFQRQRHNI